MTNFLSKYSNSDVESMRINGGLTPSFDGFGNLLISSNETILSSSVLTVSLYSPKFSTDAILKITDTQFTEFFNATQNEEQLETQSDTKALYEDKVEENKVLQDKLDKLTLELNDPEKTSDNLRAKDTIIELRIALGQGNSEADFESAFPYTTIAT